MGAPPTLELLAIRRTFRQGDARLEVLRGASLALRPGEMIALVGPSGSGKSTLLHIAGLLERPEVGEVRIEGRTCGELSDDERTAIRRRRLGFVYQYHHLLGEFSALENVAVAQMIAGVARREAMARAGRLLERMGLAARAGHRPGRLSGGERQRVAIARALANGPALLLADEPTGNLDQHTAEAVFGELLSLARDEGLAALVATHNAEIAARMDRVVRLREGIVEPA
ncbi:MAG: ABC transporter ATP-binding protein [Proteobacteria bacterium]|nr:ABC transporter ATP-binding protein [Pseudomonadota bacterium]